MAAADSNPAKLSFIYTKLHENTSEIMIDDEQLCLCDKYILEFTANNQYAVGTTFIKDVQSFIVVNLKTLNITSHPMIINGLERIKNLVPWKDSMFIIVCRFGIFSLNVENGIQELILSTDPKHPKRETFKYANIDKDIIAYCSSNHAKNLNIANLKTGKITTIGTASNRDLKFLNDELYVRENNQIVKYSNLESANIIKSNIFECEYQYQPVFEIFNDKLIIETANKFICYDLHTTKMMKFDCPKATDGGVTFINVFKTKFGEILVVLHSTSIRIYNKQLNLTQTIPYNSQRCIFPF